jgi:hypothetical protein
MVAVEVKLGPGRTELLSSGEMSSLIVDLPTRLRLGTFK